MFLIMRINYKFLVFTSLMEDFLVIRVEKALFQQDRVYTRDALGGKRLPNFRVYDLLIRLDYLYAFDGVSLVFYEKIDIRLIGFGLRGDKEHRVMAVYSDFGKVILPEGESLETLTKGDTIHVQGSDGKPGLFDGVTYCNDYSPLKSRFL